MGFSLARVSAASLVPSTGRVSAAALVPSTVRAPAAVPSVVRASPAAVPSVVRASPAAVPSVVRASSHRHYRLDVASSAPSVPPWMQTPSLPWSPPQPPLASPFAISPDLGCPLVVVSSPPPPPPPLLSFAAKRSRRGLPEPSDAGGFSPPSLLVALKAASPLLPSDFLPEGKPLPEEGRFWPWDPGICTANGGWKPPPHPVDFIHVASPKSNFWFYGRNQQGNVCWCIARVDGSFDNSAHRGVKNLKDALTSISSSSFICIEEFESDLGILVVCWYHRSCLGLCCLLFSCCLGLFRLVVRYRLLLYLDFILHE